MIISWACVDLSFMFGAVHNGSLYKKSLEIRMALSIFTVREYIDG